MSAPFPFSAIVGQEEMKLALLATAIDPAIGGVLVFGDRGTGKSTAVRALAGLLPPMLQVPGCPYNRAPDSEHEIEDGTASNAKAARGRLAPVPVVDLPLGVTEDRVVGALDLERALVHGEKAFEPGLLARANRGYLYIDEVNLLEDHIVDLLLDVAASGENVVEREGLSVRHPARFVLVGSGNPEEGELRPQLLDRFGLSVEVSTPSVLSDRIEIIRRREDYERDRDAYAKRWASREGKVRAKIRRARERLESVVVSDEIMEAIASLCIALETDGLRGELTLVRAARAIAALADADAVDIGHVREVAPMALRHRLRRDPLDEASSGTRVERAVQEVFA
ncbi:MAG: magnesium chelatase ATPase subunit I [Pseudomonadota bacterium]